MKKAVFIYLLPFILLLPYCLYGWGFYAHQKINYYAVFLLPPEMMLLYKPNIGFLSEHAVDPDKRRYAVAAEGPRHYIDIDHYGVFPYTSLPRKWSEAISKFGEDSLVKYGIAPWYIQTVLQRLTDAFRTKNFGLILRYSAEIGHYVSDIHVPLHACSNHNGQFTGQFGIHGFWESRIPELLAENDPMTIGFDFFIGKAAYIKNPGNFIWKRVLESAEAADTVLRYEKELSIIFSDDHKYSFEERNGKLTRQYSTAFTKAYNKKLDGMVERRMRQSIFAIASFWYTAWINAGQPDLKNLSNHTFSEADLHEFTQLNTQWNTAGKMIGREEQ